MLTKTKRPEIARRRPRAPRTVEHPLPDELERLREESLALLRKRARVSAVASVVPVPGADALADLAMLTELLPKITERFGLSPVLLKSIDPRLSTAALTAIRNVGPTLIGKVVTKALVVAMAKSSATSAAARQVGKFVPVVGQVGAALLGYSAFMAVGKRHIAQCVEVRLAMTRLLPARDEAT